MEGKEFGGPSPEETDYEKRVSEVTGQLIKDQIEEEEFILKGDERVGVMGEREQLTPEMLKDLTAGEIPLVGLVTSLAEHGALIKEYADAVEGNFGEKERVLLEKLQRYGEETLRMEAEARIEFDKTGDTVEPVCGYKGSGKADRIFGKLKKEHQEKLSLEELRKLSTQEVADRILEGRAVEISFAPIEYSLGGITSNEYDILWSMYSAFENRLHLQAEIEIARQTTK